MSNNIGDFITTGIAILPILMLLGTGSMEVFAVTVLTITILLVIVAAAQPFDASDFKEKDHDQ